MDLFKLYAFCTNNQKIYISPSKTVTDFNCELFNTLDEAIEQKNIKKPIDYKIFEVYSSPVKNYYKTSLKLQVTYVPPEE